MAVEVGNAYVTILPKLQSNFSGEIGSKIEKAMSTTGQTAGDNMSKGIGSKLTQGMSVLGNAAGNLLANGIGKVADLIGQNIGNAISRVDTLENFPRIMQNLGISSDSATASINKMSDRLTGLPTSLDAGASAVQRFTAANGDIDKSTDYFLALNDAILAGGQSTELQQSALEQLSQAYSKGKPDLMEWRTLLQAMPAQLNQIAQSFGMTTDELYSGLQNGSISMDDFMGRIVQLDQDGGGRFASFEQQARDATGGIQTNIANMGSAVTRGIGSIIQSIGSANIGTAIKGIGGAIEQGLKGLAPIFATAVNGIANMTEGLSAFISSPAGQMLGTFLQQSAENFGYLITQVITFVTNALPGLIAGFGMLVLPIMDVAGQIALVLGWVIDLANQCPLLASAIGLIVAAIVTWNVLMPIASAVGKAFAAVQGVINAVMSANPIALVVLAIAGLVVLLVALYQHCEPFRAFVDGIWSSLSAFFSAIGGWVTGFIGNIISFGQMVIDFFSSIGSAISNVWNFLVGLVGSAIAAIVGFFGNLSAGAGATVQNVINFFTNLPGQIIGALANIGSQLWQAGCNIINSFLAGLQNAFEGVKNFIGGIGDWIVQHKGPKSYDLRLLIPAGNWIMTGLSEGLEQGMGEVRATINDVNNMFTLSPQYKTAGQTYFTPQETKTQELTLNFYDTQTSPDAIYQKMQQVKNYGLARMR